MRIRSLIAAAAAFSSLGIMTIGSAEAGALPPGVSDEFFTYSPTGALIAANPLDDSFDGRAYAVAPGNNSKSGHYTAFTEADGSISDIVGCKEFSADQCNMVVISDDDTGGITQSDIDSLFGANAILDATVLETTTAYDVTQYQNMIASGCPGCTTTFQSDVETPEPLTLSLFGAGLVGAVGMRRRKRNIGV